MGNRRTKLRALVKDLHPEIVAEAKAEAQIEVCDLKEKLRSLNLVGANICELENKIVSISDDLKKSIAAEKIAIYELEQKEKTFRELENEVLSLRSEIAQLQLKLIESGFPVAKKEVIAKTPDKKKKKG